MNLYFHHQPQYLTSESQHNNCDLDARGYNELHRGMKESKGKAHRT